MDHPLSAWQIAKLNISRKSGRSVSLMLLVALFAFILCGGALFMNGLAQGVRQLSGRLGADLIVVPAGYKADFEGVLLKGEPSSFYLPAGAKEKIEKLEGVAAVTPQLYVATLSASCCSYPVQIIGIDEPTDFLVKPWLRSQFKGELKDNTALVGGNIVGETGEQVHFFNQPIAIVGRLERTGMGFDATIFVNMDTAKMLAKESERLGPNKAAEKGRISCLMVKAEPNVDPSKLASYISKQFADEGLFAIVSKRFINDISANLGTLSALLYGTIAIVWLLSVLILALTFSALLRERKKELATLKILGAGKSFLNKTVLFEAGLISFRGGLIGSLAGLCGSMLWSSSISRSLNIPFQTLSVVGQVTLFLFSLVIATAIAPLASYPALYKLGQSEIYLDFRSAN